MRGCKVRNVTTINKTYLTVCTFFFEINISRLPDTRCCITTLYHTVVITEWCDVSRDVLCRTTLSWRHIIGMWDKTQQRDIAEWMANIARRHAQNVASIRVLYTFLFCLLREQTASFPTRSDIYCKLFSIASWRDVHDSGNVIVDMLSSGNDDRRYYLWV
jgi:hypothetical protein